MSKEHESIKAVIFDMDGVILDTETICFRTWKIVGTQMNLPDIDIVTKACCGCNKADTVRILKNHNWNENSIPLFMEETSKQFHVIEDREGIPLKSYVRETLSSLKNAGYRIALASSTRGPVVTKQLTDAGVIDFFETITTGDMVEHSKPDPEIYIRACKSLQLSPENCIAIEDSPNGVRSARNAGMPCIMVPDQIRPDEEMKKSATIICENLNEAWIFLVQQEILQQFEEHTDSKYRDFSSGLIPGGRKKLGVRIPELRRLAKVLAKNTEKYTAFFSYTCSGKVQYTEEVLLHGLTIGYIKTDIATFLKLLAQYIPLISSWEESDVCMSMKLIGKNKEKVLNFLEPYFHSEKTYYVRAGIVILLSFFVEKEYLPKIFTILDDVSQRTRGNNYYIMMAIAWCLSICFVKLPEQTGPYLKHNMLDDTTYNKALQKICESYRCPPDMKNTIREMKRKSLPQPRPTGNGGL